jgi:hypothetical protein
MHARYPHCHNPIELVAVASLEDIVCPSCGSSFNLVGTETTESYRPGTQMLGHFSGLANASRGHSCDRVGVGASLREGVGTFFVSQ